MSRLKCLLFTFLLMSCGTQESIYHNYHEIKDCLIDWNSILNQQEDDYLVYFYSERCGHCNDIKQDILNFYFEGRYTMYFVCCDIEVVLGPRKELKGIDNINDFYIFGTPFLVRIVDHYIESYYVGSEEVKEFISILNISN